MADQSITLDAARPGPTRAQGGRPGLGLAVVLVAQVVDLLDSLVTTIAGPTITRELRGGASLIQWLTAGYTIAMAAGIMVGGRLGDIWGRRTCLLVGMTGFTVMSLLCAIAQYPSELVVLRILQGLLGALMVPQGFGLVREMFPPDKAGKAMGAMGPAIALASVSGPLLAGWLIRLDLWGTGWRMIFLVNVPLGLFGLAAGVMALPHSPRHPELRLDIPGTLLAATAMATLTYPLIQGREHHWPWWTYTMIAAAIALFAAFVALERARDTHARSTLVAASLFAKRAFVAGLATGFFLFAALIGISIALTVFTQIGLGFSPLRAAVAGLPQALGMVVGFGLAQGLTTATSKRAGLPAGAVMRAGIGVIVLALGGFILTIGHTQQHTTIWTMAPTLLAVGLGNGLAMAPFFEQVLSQVDHHELGTASGALTAAQQIGATTGIAILGTIEFTRLGPLTGWTPPATTTHATQTAVAAGAAAALLALSAAALMRRRTSH